MDEPRCGRVIARRYFSATMAKTRPNEGLKPDIATSCRLENRWQEDIETSVIANIHPRVVGFNEIGGDNETDASAACVVHRPSLVGVFRRRRLRC